MGGSDIDGFYTTEALIGALRSLFAIHGLPDTLVSDNGPQLMAGPFELYLAGQGIRHALITPFHPSSNGLVERTVCSVKDALARLGPGDWPTKVAKYLLLQHATPCPETNQSPARY